MSQSPKSAKWRKSWKTNNWALFCFQSLDFFINVFNKYCNEYSYYSVAWTRHSRQTSTKNTRRPSNLAASACSEWQLLTGSHVCDLFHLVIFWRLDTVKLSGMCSATFQYLHWRLWTRASVAEWYGLVDTIHDILWYYINMDQLARVFDKQIQILVCLIFSNITVENYLSDNPS